MRMSTLTRFLSAAAVVALVSATLVAQAGRKVYIIQTNAAGDNSHVIDAATNKVVATIEGTEVPHGIAPAHDGKRAYITNESKRQLEVIDPATWKIIKSIPLTGRPNNVFVSRDNKKVYVGIAQAPGAVDVIDAATMTNVKSVKVDGSVHNVYVTPDGKYAVSGSVATGVISVIDTKTDEVAWSYKETSGIRPMIFDTNPDGSTRNIYVQLSDYHGVAVVDFATRKETKRWELPAVPGQEKELEGLQGAPAHGFAVTPDQKVLLATSKWYGAMYAYSIPDYKLLGTVVVGSHPEWVTLTPDGSKAYLGVAGEDQTVAVDLKTMKVIARIPVGNVPKRIATLVAAR
ncbi:MAG: cytochrome D1 domain-containing protein [Vicinamibacterales bacterium]